MARARKYIGVHGDKIKTKILCSDCKKNEITVYLEPEQKHIQKICYACKQRLTMNNNLQYEETCALLGQLTHHMLMNHGAEKAVVLVPESEEFHQASEEFWANRGEKKKHHPSYHWNTFGK